MELPVRTSVEVENLLRLTKNGSVDHVINILRENPHLVNAEEASGRTIVHFAAYLGRWELIQAISNNLQNAEIDHEDFDGNTPLVLAVKQRDLQTVQILVEHHACISRRLKRNATALHHALCVPENIEVLQFLTDALGGEIDSIIAETQAGSPLHWACQSNCVVNMAFCLDDLKVPVDIVDFHGGTPLFVAAGLQHNDALRFLLERGANVKVIANDGSNAMSIILEQDNPNHQCLRTLCHFDHEGFFLACDLSKLNDASVVADLEKKKFAPSELETQSKRFKLQGDSSFQSKEYSKAVRFYTLAISYTPKNYILFSNRSACYFNTGFHRKALADALHCISLNQEWAKGYYRAAACYYEMNNFRQCNDMCDKGLSIEPTFGSLQQIKKDVTTRL